MLPHLPSLWSPAVCLFARQSFGVPLGADSAGKPSQPAAQMPEELRPKHSQVTEQRQTLDRGAAAGVDLLHQVRVISELPRSCYPVNLAR